MALVNGSLYVALPSCNVDEAVARRAAEVRLPDRPNFKGDLRFPAVKWMIALHLAMNIVILFHLPV